MHVKATTHQLRCDSDFCRNGIESIEVNEEAHTASGTTERQSDRRIHFPTLAIFLSDFSHVILDNCCLTWAAGEKQTV